MTTSGETTKIALKADALTSRVGHLRQAMTPGIWDLVVREFAVDPKGNYVDAVWEEPHEAGWVFQVCGVRAGNEHFNELEYHAPAATAVREQPVVIDQPVDREQPVLAGQNVSRDESHVWAFRGPAEAIDGVARRLLAEEYFRNVSVMDRLQELLGSTLPY
jgi:hypothetical protein